MTKVKNLPRIFYKTNNELIEILQNIKLIQCPHCGQFGKLILNGTAEGYVEGEDFPVTRRHRVVCNARRKTKKGCGGSISFFHANIVPNLRILASTLLAFALLLATDISSYIAFKNLQLDFHRRAAICWKKRILQSICIWRQNLSEIIPPPNKPQNISSLQESLNHFKVAFTRTKKFFMAYQLKFNCSIL